MEEKIQVSSVPSARMNSRNFLSLKFENKNRILFRSLNQLCLSEHLCDVRIVGSDGGEVFMHKLVLMQTFPVLRDILDDHVDKIVIIVTDYASEIIEECRENLYRTGDSNALGLVLGFQNYVSSIKVEEEIGDDAHEKGAIQEYVAMDVVHDYVEIDTLEEITHKAGLSATVESILSFQKQLELQKRLLSPHGEKKRQKKQSFSELSGVPYYFLKTCKH